MKKLVLPLRFTYLRKSKHGKFFLFLFPPPLGVAKVGGPWAPSRSRPELPPVQWHGAEPPEKAIPAPQAAVTSLKQQRSQNLMAWLLEPTGPFRATSVARIEPSKNIMQPATRDMLSFPRHGAWTRDKMNFLATT